MSKKSAFQKAVLGVKEDLKGFHMAAENVVLKKRIKELEAERDDANRVMRKRIEGLPRVNIDFDDEWVKVVKDDNGKMMYAEDVLAALQQDKKDE
jgi:hypothetical protein